MAIERRRNSGKWGIEILKRRIFCEVPRGAKRRGMGWNMMELFMFIFWNDGYFCTNLVIYWISRFWGTIPHSNHGMGCVDDRWVQGWVTPRLDKAEQRSDWSRRPLLEKLGVKAGETGVVFCHMGRSLLRSRGECLNPRHVCGFRMEDRSDRSIVSSGFVTWSLRLQAIFGRQSVAPVHLKEPIAICCPGRALLVANSEAWRISSAIVELMKRSTHDEPPQFDHWTINTIVPHSSWLFDDD